MLQTKSALTKQLLGNRKFGNLSTSFNNWTRVFDNRKIILELEDSTTNKLDDGNSLLESRRYNLNLGKLPPCMKFNDKLIIKEIKSFSGKELSSGKVLLMTASRFPHAPFIDTFKIYSPLLSDQKFSVMMGGNEISSIFILDKVTAKSGVELEPGMQLAQMKTIQVISDDNFYLFFGFFAFIFLMCIL
jgi:hypothetical protein